MESTARQEIEPATGDSDVPLHVAIIMDGNGRWAAARHLPRAEGHRRGVEAVRRTVAAAIKLGIRYLTIYSFSSENWTRPRQEIDALFELFKMFVRRDLAELSTAGVRVRVIGRRTGLPDDILQMIESCERSTRDNSKLDLVVAFNYGARDEIVRAVETLASRVAAGEVAAADVTEDMVARHLDTAGIPDPDLVIRTSGEVRLSNFLLWQCAYSEFVFHPGLWPDFSEEDLAAAIEEFYSRSRRYGGRDVRSSA